MTRIEKFSLAVLCVVGAFAAFILFFVDRGLWLESFFILGIGLVLSGIGIFIAERYVPHHKDAEEEKKEEVKEPDPDWLQRYRRENRHR